MGWAEWYPRFLPFHRAGHRKPGGEEVPAAASRSEKARNATPPPALPCADGDAGPGGAYGAGREAGAGP